MRVIASWSVRFVHGQVAAWLSVCTLVGCVGSSRAVVQECIAPANPGGGWDLTCRSAAQVLGELGLSRGTMRVVNMPGAGGGVAYAHTVTQRNQDPRVLVAASPATTLRLAQRQYGRFTEHDVRWVAAIGAEYGVLAVRHDAPWPDLQALVAAWRRQPESVVVGGGSAMAGQDHMKVLLLAHRAGADPRRIRYVPFDGGGEAMTSLLGGFVQVFSGEVSEVEGQLDAGNMRVLAVLAPERLRGSLADVPTAIEQGFDIEWITWRGFYVPAGIADSVYADWVSLMRQLGSSESWARARRANRLQPFLRVGDEFSTLVEEQVESFRAMSREIGLIP